MRSKTGVSRRNFMQTAAGAVAVPAAVATSANVAADSAEVLVAATVVRASLSRTERGVLRVGVRVSVMADDFANENIVVTVDGVRFGASTDATRKVITSVVQERVATELAAIGSPVPADRIAVQVFGGVL